MPDIDNFAHAGGFLGGYATSAFFNPLTRERGDHMLMAVVCLVATLAGDRRVAGDHDAVDAEPFSWLGPRGALLDAPALRR